MPYIVSDGKIEPQIFTQDDVMQKLKEDKHISNAEIFGDVKGNLTVNIVLRRPIARLVRNDGPDAYVAEDGEVAETWQ